MNDNISQEARLATPHHVMEKKEFKRYIVIAVLAVAVCFIVQNFAVFTKVISAALGALYPLALGAVMAYIINIIMKWYEEHYFPKKDTKFINWIILKMMKLLIL